MPFELPFAEILREYLLSIQGKEVSLTDLRRELRIDPTSTTWDGLREQMRNMKKEGLVKPVGRVQGLYKVIAQIQPVRVFTPDRTRRPPTTLYFPKDFSSDMELFFAEYITLREGDLITIGGTKSSGKTQFCLSICAQNIDAHPVLMGNEYTVWADDRWEPAPRFLDRLDRMSAWVEWTNGDGTDKFTLLPVSDDYAEHIIPGKINIIDWINLDANALYDIGKVLRDIKAVNGRGISVAAMQKSEQATNPRGGQFVRDFSDLEILLDSFGNRPHEAKLTIKGAKEATKPMVGKTFAYTIGEGGTKIFNFREIRKCPGCSGSGIYKGHECDECFGTGYRDV